MHSRSSEQFPYETQRARLLDMPCQEKTCSVEYFNWITINQPKPDDWV